MSYFPPENDWLDGATAGSSSLYKSIYFPASLCVQGVGEGVAGCESDGDDNEDLVLVVPFLQREVCEQINKSLGLPETPVALSGNLWAATPVKFQGTFADGQILDQNGLQAGCIAGSGTNNPPANSYHFVQVLVAR
ncbi:MAG: hypothetical protein LRY36_01125 [Alphaproteobacteria bacterium]|nr:hypothetical protein [Alphaproteobacteria bacterium]